MYSQEFYSVIESITKDINDAELSLISVHPIDIVTNTDSVLTEAIINADTFKNAKDKLFAVIKKLTDTFIRITNKLEIRNKELVKRFESLTINPNVMNDFEYTIFPYWKGLDRIKGFRLPQFNISDSNDILNNDGIPYKQSKFPRGTFNEEDWSVNMSYFRGADKEMTVDKNQVSGVFEQCLNIVKSRREISRKLSSENRYLMSLLSRNKAPNENNVQNQENNKQQVTESVLLDLSLFKDEYIDMLYEDAVATTNEIEKEEKKGNGRIEVNQEENSRFRNAMNTAKTAIKYVEICYSVNSKVMNILDEAYDKTIKFCDKIASYSPKNNKETK